MHPPPQKIDGASAIILCGGKSTRMGRDKASLIFEGRTLLQAVELTMTKLVGRVFVVIGKGQALPEGCLPTTKIIADETGGLGPLEGLRAGMQRCSAEGQTALVATCDAPRVSAALFHALHNSLDAHQAAVPHIDGQAYPLTAIYRTSVLSAIEQMLGDDQLRVMDLLTRIDCRRVDRDTLAEVDLRCLASINTPEEYDRLLSQADSSRSGFPSDRD